MKPETRCVKIKLKPNSIEKVREWSKTLNERKDEVLATLRDEGVILETVFLDQNLEGDFLIYVMRAEDFEKSKTAFEKSAHAIDAYHQNFKDECWLGGERLERLFEFELTDEIFG